MSEDSPKKAWQTGTLKYTSFGSIFRILIDKVLP